VNNPWSWSANVGQSSDATSTNGKAANTDNKGPPTRSTPLESDRLRRGVSLHVGLSRSKSRWRRPRGIRLQVLLPIPKPLLVARSRPLVTASDQQEDQRHRDHPHAIVANQCRSICMMKLLRYRRLKGLFAVHDVDDAIDDQSERQHARSHRQQRSQTRIRGLTNRSP